MFETVRSATVAGVWRAAAATTHSRVPKNVCAGSALRGGQSKGKLSPSLRSPRSTAAPASGENYVLSQCFLPPLAMVRQAVESSRGRGGKGTRLAESCDTCPPPRGLPTSFRDRSGMFGCVPAGHWLPRRPGRQHAYTSDARRTCFLDCPLSSACLCATASAQQPPLQVHAAGPRKQPGWPLPCPPLHATGPRKQPGWPLPCPTVHSGTPGGQQLPRRMATAAPTQLDDLIHRHVLSQVPHPSRRRPSVAGP
jgi:hypothetical protein